MTINTKSLELRNLFPENRPEGVKCCTVCGKPSSALSKEVRALPMHAKALAEDWAGKFRSLTRILGSKQAVIDFVQNKNFNAQLEYMRQQLTLAREEHDAYQPKEIETDKAKTTRLLKEMLQMMNVSLPPVVEGEKATNVLGLVELLHKATTRPGQEAISGHQLPAEGAEALKELQADAAEVTGISITDTADKRTEIIPLPLPDGHSER